MRRSLVTSFGGVTAAFIGSLCCSGPLLFVAFGIGAGLGSTFEPLRPLFGAMMLGFFAFGFHRVYARRPAMATEQGASSGGTSGSFAAGAACELPRRRDRDAAILWTSAVIALALWTFPTWSRLFL